MNNARVIVQNRQFAEILFVINRGQLNFSSKRSNWSGYWRRPVQHSLLWMLSEKPTSTTFLSLKKHANVSLTWLHCCKPNAKWCIAIMTRRVARTVELCAARWGHVGTDGALVWHSALIGCIRGNEESILRQRRWKLCCGRRCHGRVVWVWRLAAVPGSPRFIIFWLSGEHSCRFKRLSRVRKHFRLWIGQIFGSWKIDF